MVIGKVPQIVQNIKQGHTGQLSLITYTLALLGNIARVVTILSQVKNTVILVRVDNDTPAISDFFQFAHLAAGIFNAIIVLQVHTLFGCWTPVLQMVLYWSQTAKYTKGTVDKKIK